MRTWLTLFLIITVGMTFTSTFSQTPLPKKISPSFEVNKATNQLKSIKTSLAGKNLNQQTIELKIQELDNLHEKAKICVE